jgi:cytidylate kinase
LKEIYHIAIDGPTAGGKGTVARALSARLGIPCLDTGAMYRAAAVYMRGAGIDAKNQTAVTGALDDLEIDVTIKDGVTQTSVNGKDVTPNLRENDISCDSSIIATYPAVRKFMVARQQEIAKTESFILEGRDIASAVLPDAKYKFYLTAKVRTRALRRQADLKVKGTEITINEMIKQIKQRDRRDIKKGGLKCVSGAVVIDDTNLNIEETIEKFISYIK